MSLTVILFAILSILAIATAIMTIASKHPVKSAFSLVAHFFMLAGLYLTLNAQFIAVMQVIVYAGAIMVLVIFVIMLLNLGDEEKMRLKMQSRQLGGIVLGGGLAVLLVSVLMSHPSVLKFVPEKAAANSTAQAIGKELFTNYLFPFEAVSILLLATIVGAVVLAKRKIQ